MRAFAIVAILITLLVAVYLVTRDMTSRMSENEGQSKITAIEKAKETERKINQLNKGLQKKLKENKVEVKLRRTGERFDVELNELLEKIKEIIS